MLAAWEKIPDDRLSFNLRFLILDYLDGMATIGLRILL
ncbi:hypothetical protein RINTHM_9680 [Richelia intracellularis HM01]|nr:hypothetical protein RINTHM_9680 [Richelia intracellularis HM01]